MANGDAGAAAGMTVVAGTASRSLGYDEINKTRDYVAGGHAFWTPGLLLSVARGGTGASTQAQAQTNLGVKAAVDAVAGAITGGTGANDEGRLLKVGSGGRINVGTPTSGQNAATKQYVDDNTGSSTAKALADTGVAFNRGASIGGSAGWQTSQNMGIFGHLYVPNASAASSGYVVAYINGDGRLCKGASSRRYKRNVRSLELTPGSMFTAPLREFQWKEDEGTQYHVGLIAEEAAAEPQLERFVVTDPDGNPEAIDYIELLLGMVYDLNARLAKLEQA